MVAASSSLLVVLEEEGEEKERRRRVRSATFPRTLYGSTPEIRQSNCPQK